MNRMKAITSSLRYLKSSSLATRVLATRNQVSHFSSSSFSLPLLNRSKDLLCFHNNHQKHYFSSKPNMILERVFTNDWSEELEKELEACRESLTHETVVYVLKRLDKNPIKVFTFFNWVSEKEWFMASSSVYSLVLRVLASNKEMKEFWIVLRAMKEKGFYLDEETYLTISTGLKRENLKSDIVALSHFYKGMLEQNAMQNVVKKVVGIISGSDWDDKVENELEKVKIQLSDNFVIRVMKELRDSPLKAYKFFHWVGKQSGYQQNTVTYNAVARVLPRMESIEEFWSILEEMKSVGHELDLDTYIKISRQLQKNKMMEDAVKLYEHMMDSSYKPSVLDCIMLLKSISASDKPNLDLVFRVAKKFESSGYTLSKAVYDGIHRSLTSAGKFDEAEKIVETMKNAGYEPDNITYSQLIFGLCKTGRFEEALKVIDDMKANNIWVDIKTWTILIQGYCDAGKLDDALFSLYKMIETKDADAELLEVLVEGFLKQKRIDGAYKLLLEISTKCRTCPRQATFKKLIDSLLGVRKFEEALDLLRLMKSKQYPPYHEPFVSHISKFGTMEDAAEFLRVLSLKNYPSHTVYLQIFESLFQEGRLSEAKDLLYKCPHHIRKHSKISELFGSSKSQTAETQATDSQIAAT
ncbi:pentatricopeptide repeat-containing protein At3g48250, chloroplastic [Medicago truncatula]|nr:pentatricopeptide repeat-containing protein At3g48250, chloroplastic [Medicago truncatula]